jgi:hypothetical protein
MAAQILTLGSTPAQVLSDIASCHDLDEVLAIGTPAQLVRLLFGESGTKALVEPFGDALVRGLARSIPGLSSPSSVSSIAFAMACTNVLDPQRLAKILALDDGGYNLCASLDLTSFADDITTVVGSYRDANRRLQLLTSLWAQTLAWHEGQAKATGFVGKVQVVARKIASEVELSVQGLSPSESQHMLLEWLLQRFLNAESLCTKHMAQGHAFLATTGARARQAKPTLASDAKRLQSAIDLLQAHDRLTAALPKEKPNRKHLGDLSKQHSHRLWSPSWKHQRARILRLCRLGGFPGVIDGISGATAATWMEPGMLYFGVGSHVELNIGPDAVQRRPPPCSALPASIASLARFVRMGAAVPTKPKNWQAFVLELVEPYYVHLTIQIKHPNWIKKVDGTVLGPTDLVVRAPKDMRELALWGTYMGNCVHSIFGDDVHEGKRVILGLFRNDTLVYNVGAFAGEGSEGTVWEVNGRFNNDEVEPGVQALIQSLIFSATRELKSPKPANIREPRTRTSTAPKSVPRTWTPKRVSELGRRVRGHASADWVQSAALLSNGSPAKWVESITRIQRLSLRTTLSRFEEQVAQGEKLWPLLVKSPLDALVLDSPWTDPERKALVDLRNGSPRIKRKSTAPLLDDSALSAAWEFAKTSAHLRNCFVQLAFNHPREVAEFLQNDPSGIARWVSAVLWVLRSDEVEPVVTKGGLRTVVFEIPANIVREVVSQLSDFKTAFEVPDDAFGMPDEAMTWTEFRLNRGLAVPRCPQVWLRRNR